MTLTEKNPPETFGENIDTKFIDGSLFKKMARGGAALLRQKADEVNKLNVFPVPDGDTGDNMRMTIESGIEAVEKMDSDDLSEVMKVLSHGMLLGARGNSGVILSQFFAGVSMGLETSDKKADPLAIGKALESGVKKAYSSVMKPTEGTILTVARESVEYAVDRLNPDSTVRSLFADLVKEMYLSLERTPEALEVLKESGVVDSGGAGLFYIMDGFNRVLNGETVSFEFSAEGAGKSSAVDYSAFGPDSVMTYGYCTELLVRLQNAKVDVDSFDVEPLKQYLDSIGDSVVAFKTDSIVKLHVHTFTPEKVLGYCRNFGEFLTVKIENMSVQHTEASGGQENINGTPVDELTIDGGEDKAEKSASPLKKNGLVAVCNGPGIEALFRELGVDEIVNGGQTQNPSTNDFLDAFSKISAERIFVLPNNGNIVMAARQAAEIYKGAEIYVIPSKNIGEGYAAVSSADFESDDAESIIAEMEEATKRVTAGFVSPAIRDANMNGVRVKKGGAIGIIGKEIAVSEPDCVSAARSLAAKLLELPDTFMLTVFCGKDAESGEREELEAYLNETYPSSEIYFIDGGQDIYPYVFIVE